MSSTSRIEPEFGFAGMTCDEAFSKCLPKVLDGIAFVHIPERRRALQPTGIEAPDSMAGRAGRLNQGLAAPDAWILQVCDRRELNCYHERQSRKSYWHGAVKSACYRGSKKRRGSHACSGTRSPSADCRRVRSKGVARRLSRAFRQPWSRSLPGTMSQA